jgi:hypothetical protein
MIWVGVGVSGNWVAVVEGAKVEVGKRGRVGVASAWGGVVQPAISRNNNKQVNIQAVELIRTEFLLDSMSRHENLDFLGNHLETIPRTHENE